VVDSLVIEDTYHSVGGLILHQCAVKDLCQVGVFGSRSMREIVHKRHIKE